MANQPSTGMWLNADGLLVKFGGYYKTPANFVNRSRQLNSLGGTRQIEIDVDLTQLNAGATSFTTDLTGAGTVNGFNTGDVFIPAFASIKSVYFVTNVPFAGGTSITVGTYQANGTASPSANSLMTTTAGATANFTPSGAKVLGDGALTATTAGTASVGTHNVYIGITTAGTFTAGTGKLIVEYIETNIPEANLP